MIKILFLQTFEVYFGFVYLFGSECIRLMYFNVEFSVNNTSRLLFVR